MKTTRVEFYYHADGLPVGDLFVVGSWNDDGVFDATWPTQGTKMVSSGCGRFQASLDLQVEAGQSFWWGVKDENHHWMLFETPALEFHPTASPQQEHVLGYRHKLGIHRQAEDGFSAAIWAPNAQAVSLLILGEKEHLFPMRRGGQFWELEAGSGWSDILGRPYGFRILTSCGQSVVRVDPYARVRQGPQRGVSDLFVTKQGGYAHRYSVPKDGLHLLRFEAVAEHELSQAPVLRLFREGRQLSRSDLSRLLQRTPKLPEGEVWWKRVAKPNGDIPLNRSPGISAYSVCVGPETRLRGLSYEITDHRGSTYHDPWSDQLDGHHNWPRLGIVTEARRVKQARPSPTDRDLVMYQVHVGSLLGEGGNLKTSTFADLERQLPTIKRLGFNAVALMPTNATEGWRDWGYLGTCSLAHQEAYAAPGKDAEESLLSFVDRAHKLGMRVFTDVVYNHVGGFHNDLWEFDGLENCWFERSDSVESAGGALPERPFQNTDNKPRTKNSTVRDTPWGPIPAYPKPEVSQFFVDHAMDQIERLGFDGIRFDFTHLIHAADAGGSAGWEMLRAIHRRLSYFFPETITFAEEFPPHPIMNQSVDEGGAGFTGMWNTEHQHRLIFDHHRPSVTQNLAEGSEPPLDYFAQHLMLPEGFSDPLRSATVLSNHDEVGNAQRLYHIVKTHPRGFDIARLVSWFSLLCPGYGLLFQGTEDLASNFFSWGLPHTWDVDSHLLRPLGSGHRQRQLVAVRDVLHFRRQEPGLWADSPIDEVFRDTFHHVLAIRRGEFWVVGNFDEDSQEVETRLTHDSDLVLSLERPTTYGYMGKTTRGSRIGGYSVKVWRKRPSSL
jgi:maltooligosyltrehalose trehalohydrolase